MTAQAHPRAMHPEAPQIPKYMGYLCVECPKCRRGRVFNALSAVAMMEVEEAGRRLKYERCGTRPRLYRAPTKTQVRQ